MKSVGMLVRGTTRCTGTLIEPGVGATQAGPYGQYFLTSSQCLADSGLASGDYCTCVVFRARGQPPAHPSPLPPSPPCSNCAFTFGYRGEDADVCGTNSPDFTGALAGSVEVVGAKVLDLSTLGRYALLDISAPLADAPNSDVTYAGFYSHLDNLNQGIVMAHYSNMDALQLSADDDATTTHSSVPGFQFVEGWDAIACGGT